MKKLLLLSALIFSSFTINAQICYERISTVVFSPIANSTDIQLDITSDCCDIHQFVSYTITSNGTNHVISLCYLDTGLLMPSTITSSITLAGLNTGGDQNFTFNAAHHFNHNWPNPIDCNSTEYVYPISPVTLSLNTPLTQARTFNLETTEQQLKKTSLFPNPNSGSFTLELPSDDQAAVKVSDLSGKTVFTTERYFSGEPIDLKGLANGLYFVTVKRDKSTETLKFIVR